MIDETVNYKLRTNKFVFIIPYVPPVTSNVTAIVDISFTDGSNGSGEQNASLTLVKVSDEKEKTLIAAAAGDTTIRKLIGSSFDLAAATTDKTLTDIMELKFDMSREDLQGVDTSKLSAFRYELDANGKLQVVRLGGKYDPKTKLFTCKTNKTGFIGIGQVDSLKQIELSANSKEIMVNGEKTNLDVAPIIINGRTLVPVRFITESMGATVEWDDKTGTVTITHDGKVLKLREDPTNPTAPTMIRNSRMLVPVRYISEQFGANVMWSQSSQTVYIIAK